MRTTMENKKKTVALCGATGFIGTHLSSHLRGKGHTVVPIGRELLTAGAAEKLIEALTPCDTVINVAGATIDHRWSDKYKHLLYESRIGVVRRLVEAMDRCQGVDTFVSASAVGFYPSAGCHDERSEEAGEDFLARLCRDWEAEAHRTSRRIRTIVTRFGVVLAPDGGAFLPMARPARMGVGAILGRGRQPFTWIDLRDLCRAINFLCTSNLSGTFNLVAPQKMSQREAAQLISAHYGAWFSVHVPAFVIRILKGEAADTLLKGQCAEPAALLDAGFEFCSPQLELFLNRLRK